MAKSSGKLDNSSSCKESMRLSRSTRFIQDIVKDIFDAVSSEECIPTYRVQFSTVSSVRFVHDQNVAQISTLASYKEALLKTVEGRKDVDEPEMKSAINSKKKLILNKKVDTSNNIAIETESSNIDIGDQEMIVKNYVYPSDIVLEEDSFSSAVDTDAETVLCNEAEPISTLIPEQEEPVRLEDNFIALNNLLMEKLQKIEAELETQKLVNDKQTSIIEKQVLIAYKQKHEAYKQINSFTNVGIENLNAEKKFRNIYQICDKMLNSLNKKKDDYQGMSKCSYDINSNTLNANEIMGNIRELKLQINKLDQKVSIIMRENTYLDTQNKCLAEELLSVKNKCNEYSKMNEILRKSERKNSDKASLDKEEQIKEMRRKRNVSKQKTSFVSNKQHTSDIDRKKRKRLEQDNVNASNSISTPKSHEHNEKDTKTSISCSTALKKSKTTNGGKNHKFSNILEDDAVDVGMSNEKVLNLSSNCSPTLKKSNSCSAEGEIISNHSSGKERQNNEFIEKILEDWLDIDIDLSQMGEPIPDIDTGGDEVLNISTATAKPINENMYERTEEPSDCMIIPLEDDKFQSVDRDRGAIEIKSEKIKEETEDLSYCWTISSDANLMI